MQSRPLPGADSNFRLRARPRPKRSCSQFARRLAGDGESALMNMPEMDGYELLLWIRSKKAFDSMRIVMVTTETEADQITKALEHGADEYVMKPFTREVILDKLQMIGVETAS
jgi:PleD family two-component response regulator